MNNLQDIRQTKEYVCFMEKMGWKVEKIDNTYIFIKKLPLLPFSIAKVLRFKNLSSGNELKKIVKKHRVLFLKLHPFVLSNPGFNLSTPGLMFDKAPLIPTKTIWVDLKKTEKQLLAEMKKKVRYSINFAKKKIVKTKTISGNKITDKQLNDFYQIWSKNKPYNWLFKPSFNELKYLKESFGKKCFFVFAYKIKMEKKELISHVLILTSENMAFDWSGANTKLGRKFLAKSLILWEAIKESKNKGLKVFDFEGIYDPRFHKAQKGWQGFSFFKKGFGGEEVEFSSPLTILLPGRA